MSYTYQFIAAILVAGLFVSACQIVDPNPEASLVNTRWTLTSRVLQSQESTTAQLGDFTLMFSPTGEVSGNAQCNKCGGSYAISGEGNLMLSASCTEIGCIEYEYFPFAVPFGESTYRITGRVLEIRQHGTVFFYMPW